MNEILQTLTPEQQQLALMMLKEISESDDPNHIIQSLYDSDFEEIPVDIDTFIEDERYIGWYTNNGKDIYPYWRDRLREIFDGNYSEIALTGSIGVGKSSIAVIALAYILYSLMCLRDPHKYYGIGKGGYIYIVFFNATLDLSKGVAYTKMQSMLQNSPWFMERGKVTGTKYLEYTPFKDIRFTVGSQIEHSLGKDIFAGILDEVSFVKGADIHMEKSKIMKTYNSVLERMGSRFTVNGKLAGKLFIVSSKASEYDFLESYIRRQKGKPGVYVADAKLWEVKPTGTYSGKTFRVAVGGSNLPSRILRDDESAEDVLKQGFEILDVPIEFKGRFEMDIQAALMNIAGISISHVTKFIAYDKLQACYCDDQNPFTSNIISTGLNDSLAIKDFFKPELVPPELYTRPLFVHFDCSLTGDRTGIGCVAAMGFKYNNVYDIDKGEMVPTKELVYKHVFSLGIQCPNGTEISFQKNREFIYYLKYTLGWNISAISLDGYQSADSKQQFIIMGFDDSSIVSLDKKPDGYLAFKSAINEKRISMLHIEELETEIIRLERDNMTGKIDHPVDGSKDISDGLAGALYNASMHENDYDFELIESIDDMLEVNDDSIETKLHEKVNKKSDEEMVQSYRDLMDGFLI